MRPTAYFETELPDLPLTRLRDRTFEVLAHALAEAEIGRCPGRFTRVTLLREGADQGRDVLLFDQERVVGVIQCKRYSSTITLPAVLRELLRFALLAVRDPNLVPQADGFLYELWTAGEITGEAQAFFDAPHTWIDTNRAALLVAAAKARTNVVALSATDQRVIDAENEAAASLVRRFAISTVGPVTIKSRLADNDVVRLRFFRGPNDQPRRARASDVERLMANVRREDARSTLPAARYVGRSSLEREFQTFMASPSRLLAVVGGSGRGKSTWASWVRDHAPPATRVDIVRGEDIHSSDQHVADTIARILQSQRLDGLTAADLLQGVFDWFDDPSRLIIIDGIDRAPADAGPMLHEWLRRTFTTAGHRSARFVVTCRPAAWAVVAPSIRFDRAEAYRPEGAAADGFPALELGLLTREEANEVYRTHGLVCPRAPARFFRVPGLIAREAAVRSRVEVRVGTRVAVLSETVGDLRLRLQRDHNIGPQQFAHLLDLIGESLVETQDGRFSAAALRARAPESLAALDAALQAELAVSDGDLIRVEPDDLIEYLIALRLSPTRARTLLDHHGGDLLIGAAALAVARLEEVDHDAVREAIRALRDGAIFNGPAFSAAAQAVTELRERALVREQLDEMLLAWKLPNLIFALSPLSRLLDEVDLPAVERLQAAMSLSGGEDTWDWRGKYFSDPSQKPLRSITGFGRAAARATADDPAAALMFLLQLVDEAEASESGFDRYESVVSGLLYLAIDGAPALAAQVAWSERLSGKAWLLGRVCNTQPEAVAALLGTITSPQADRDAAIARLWAMTSEPPLERHNDPKFRLAVATAAGAQLTGAESDSQIVRLLVARLLSKPTGAEEARLTALWASVDDDVFWLAVEVRTGDRVGLLAERLSRGAPDEASAQLLQLMPAELFSFEEWQELVALLEAAAQQGLGSEAAGALESLLYRAAVQGGIERLMPLARKFASSDDADVRRPLIYFSGGPSTRGLAATAREELLGLLVEHESGANLDPLVWKIVQSAPEFRSGLQHFATLFDKCGSNQFDAVLARNESIEPTGFEILRREWKRLPKATRPRFKAFAGRRRSV